MDYLNQLKQTASGLMGGASSSSNAVDSGSGKTLLYAAVFALFAAVCYWAYTTYLAPMLSNGNASLKQGASRVEGDGTAADGADFEDAPIAELYLFKTDWCPHCKRALEILLVLDRPTTKAVAYSEWPNGTGPVVTWSHE